MKNYKFLILILFFFSKNIKGIFPQIKISTPEECVNIALSNNQELKISKEFLNIQQKNKNLSGYIPEISLSFQSNDSVRQNSLNYGNNDLSVLINQKIAGNTSEYYQSKIKEQQLKIEYNNISRQEEEFKRKVWLKFLEVQSLQNKVISKENSLLIFEESLKILQQKVDLGMETELNFDNFKIQFFTLQNELIEIKNQLFNSTLELKEFLNIDFYTELEIQNQNNSNEFYQENSIQFLDNEDFLATMIKSSNDIKSKNLEKELLFIQRKKMHTCFIPEVYLKWKSNFEGSCLPLIYCGSSLSINFSFKDFNFLPASINKNFNQSKTSRGEETSSSLNIPVKIDYFTKLKEINLECKKIEEEIQSLKQNLLFKAKKLFSSYYLTLQEIKLETSKIELLEKNIQIQKQKFINGEITNTEYINNLQQLDEENIKLIDYQNKLQSAYFEIQILIKS